MEKVILFGNGQVAASAFADLQTSPDYEVVAFTVDREFIDGSHFLGLPVLAFETVEQTLPPSAHKMLVSVSFRHVNRLRAEKYREAKAKGYQLISTVNPRASLSPAASFGDNCRIGAGAVIDPFVTIGNNVTIASGVVVGHHTVIGDHSFLSAGVVVSGSVTVEAYCFLGTGSVIRDRITLARESVIGAGALILENTQPRGVYLGRNAERLSISSDRLPLE